MAKLVRRMAFSSMFDMFIKKKGALSNQASFPVGKLYKPVGRGVYVGGGGGVRRVPKRST